MITRIAPSPSGYLHAGNAVNFLLTDWLAATKPGSRVHLRIDDIALPGAPDVYLEDIFWAVAWLGIRITDGPTDPASFRSGHSQTARVADYRQVLPALLADPSTFVCGCSRTDVAARRPGDPDPCRGAGLDLVPGHTALRFTAPAGVVRDEMGDFVVWRRDDLPAYQLVSVWEDARRGVDVVVRGTDLLPSTAAQQLLAPVVGAVGFSEVAFVHHPLVTDAAGHKLSKRDDADSLRAIADTPGGRDRLLDLATRIGRQVGISPAGTA